MQWILGWMNHINSLCWNRMPVCAVAQAYGIEEWHELDGDLQRLYVLLGRQPPFRSQRRCVTDYAYDDPSPVPVMVLKHTSPLPKLVADPQTSQIFGMGRQGGGFHREPGPITSLTLFFWWGLSKQRSHGAAR